MKNKRLVKSIEDFRQEINMKMSREGVERDLRKKMHEVKTGLEFFN